MSTDTLKHLRGLLDEIGQGNDVFAVGALLHAAPALLACAEALELVMKHVYCQNDYTSREYEEYYASVEKAQAALDQFRKVTL